MTSVLSLTVLLAQASAATPAARNAEAAPAVTPAPGAVGRDSPAEPLSDYLARVRQEYEALPASASLVRRGFTAGAAFAVQIPRGGVGRTTGSGVLGYVIWHPGAVFQEVFRKQSQVYCSTLWETGDEGAAARRAYYTARMNAALEMTAVRARRGLPAPTPNEIESRAAQEKWNPSELGRCQGQRFGLWAGRLLNNISIYEQIDDVERLKRVFRPVVSFGVGWTPAPTYSLLAGLSYGMLGRGSRGLTDQFAGDPTAWAYVLSFGANLDAVPRLFKLFK